MVPISDIYNEKSNYYNQSICLRFVSVLCVKSRSQIMGRHRRRRKRICMWMWQLRWDVLPERSRGTKCLRFGARISPSTVLQRKKSSTGSNCSTNFLTMKSKTSTEAPAATTTTTRRPPSTSYGKSGRSLKNCEGCEIKRLGRKKDQESFAPSQTA